MKAGWQVKTLNQIAENLDNKRIPITKSDRIDGNYPYYGASGIVDYVRDYIFDCDALLISEDGANLLARSTPIAFPASGKYWVNNHAHILKFDSLVTQRFVELYIDSIPLDEYITGAAQPKLNQKSLNSIPVPIPPTIELQRIVAILDQAFEGIAKARANAEQNLQNSCALFESHLQSLFSVCPELVEGRGESWINATLGQYIKFIDYRGKTPEKTEGGLRLITAKNVKMGYLQDNPREYVAPKTYGSWMTRGIPRLGDVLFTTEAPLANVAQLDTDEKVVFAQRIIIMQPDASKLDSTFLKYMLLSEPIQKRIHDKGTGATVKGIKASLLKNIQISFPNSVPEQAKIVDKFDALSTETKRLEALYQRKIALLDELKKSLLQQAFAGEL
jgi:type I restriction enzyme, S subunit